MLGEVEETIYVVDDEEDEQEEKVRTVKKQSEMLFVRGKAIPYLSRAVAVVVEVCVLTEVNDRGLGGFNLASAMTLQRDRIVRE